MATKRGAKDYENQIGLSLSDFLHENAETEEERALQKVLWDYGFGDAKSSEYMQPGVSLNVQSSYFAAELPVTPTVPNTNDRKSRADEDEISLMKSDIAGEKENVRKGPALTPYFSYLGGNCVHPEVASIPLDTVAVAPLSPITKKEKINKSEVVAKPPAKSKACFCICG